MTTPSSAERFEQLAGTFPVHDPVWLHGLLTGFASTPDPDEEALRRLLELDASDLPWLETDLLVDLLREDLDVFELSPVFGPRGEDRPKDWLRGYFDAVRAHEGQWEELTAAEPSAGIGVAILQSCLDEDLDEVFGMAALGDGDLDNRPALIRGLAISIHHALRGRDEAEIGRRMAMGPIEVDADALRQLDVDELLGLVASHGDRLSRDVIDECATRGEAMAEALRGLVAESQESDGDLPAETWWTPLHAAMILGLMSGPGVAEALLETFLRVDEDEDLTDWLAGYWPALFRRSFEHATEPLRGIADDADRDCSLRYSAACCVLAAGEAAGADRLEREIDWLAGLAADQDEQFDCRTLLAQLLLDLPRTRHRGLLDRLAKLQEQGLPGFIGFGTEDVSHSYATGDEPEWRRFADPWEFYEPKAIRRRQARWLTEAEVGEADEYGDYDPYPSDSQAFPYGDLPPVETYVREAPKIGRNDPCPCGSGKKYKKCCGR